MGDGIPAAVDEAERLVGKIMQRGSADQSVIERVVARARHRPPPSVLAEQGGADA